MYTPTKKWFTAFVTGAAAVLTSGIESGFDQSEKAMAIALGLALVTAYIKRNDPTPGGVPAPTA